jgi:hypothetical protein
MPNVFVSNRKMPIKGDMRNENIPGNSPQNIKSRTEDLENIKKLSRNHPLTSFCYYPENVKFVNEDTEEKIILLLRRHQITNIKWVLMTIILIVLPAFLSVMPFFDFLPYEYLFVGGMIWYLAVSAFVFEQFLGWFFNVNIITDERIIEVDFVNLIYREMTDANIDQIQDVTVQVAGAIETSLNFGDVVIQTAAEIPMITFETIPNPDAVAKVLRELRIEEEIEKLEGRVR